MKISTKTRYGIRGLLDLYFIGLKTGKPVSILDISNRQNISTRYLENIFFELKKSGIIESIKGKYGGFVLSKDISTITLLDIMKSLETSVDILDCVSEDGSCLSNPINENCVPNKIWKEINEKIKKELETYTLKDFVDKYYEH